MVSRAVITFGNEDGSTYDAKRLWFDERISDFRERFEFYWLANSIKGEGDKDEKALFIMLLGQATFAKLKH